ncbi:MAG: threonine--tRNA ligase [Peptococcaceae bacterium]|nr:threonine--tRNA ligase [Peptococcaceae bacterium]
MIKVTLKDGKVREYGPGTTLETIVKDLGPRIAKETLAARVNGELRDLSFALTEDAVVEFLTFAHEDGQKIYRHSTAHILAQAVKRLYPDAKLAIGPAIADGFYYDFDVEEPFTREDLAKIEDEMKKIIKEDLTFERFEASRDEALSLARNNGEPYKVELIEDLPEDAPISFYRQGEFVDLCAGPHVPSTSRIKAVKLLNVAGAYWRGDERNKMLQRIYGTSFPKQSLLDDYLRRLEEAKRRDHRRLGVELGLFGIHEEGPGFPFFYPKGMILRNELERFWREEHERAGYQEIKTPIILRQDLWERSGHWDHYKENMYFTSIDEENYAIKPMNCPGGILVYKSKVHSYRELPIRLGELGLVHRHELSGVLHGLMRVRAFTQDDAHIFARPAQVEDEIVKIIDMVEYFYRDVFGFDYHVELSTKPEKAMGSDEIWDMATNALRKAMETKGLAYKVNEGDGAFYGPKIDFHLQDCLGRTWQCGTIQVDFQMPEKFDLSYVGEDGERHRPVMLHRVIFGSLERFIAILTEHFAGAFPVWLAPVQVKVLPITDRQANYAKNIEEKLTGAGLRVEVDLRNEKIGYKIREAQVQKIPYMLVVGDKEVTNNTVAVRHRSEGDLGSTTLDAFIVRVTDEIRNKTR